MSMMKGRLEIEPFIVEGAFVFFVAAENSFGLPISNIYGTNWQKEFETDFKFNWTDENRFSSHSLTVIVSSSVYAKWLSRATCTLEKP